MKNFDFKNSTRIFYISKAIAVGRKIKKVFITRLDNFGENNPFDALFSTLSF